MDKMEFECFAKQGRGWSYLGQYSAKSSIVAARIASYLQSRKIIGVRPAYSTIPIHVFRFDRVPVRSQ